jgi:hypothetical protein
MNIELFPLRLTAFFVPSESAAAGELGGGIELKHEHVWLGTAAGLG